MYSAKDTVFDCRFPHSDICGSRVVRTSPQLFAAYHVFRRLLRPRHPPNALMRLFILIMFLAFALKTSFYCLCHTHTQVSVKVSVIYLYSAYCSSYGLSFPKPLSTIRSTYKPKFTFLYVNLFVCLFLFTFSTDQGDRVLPRIKGHLYISYLSFHKKQILKRMVEVNGIEPMTSCVQSRRSPS